MYSAATIFCGHVGDDVKSYPAGTKAHGRGQWYAMQVEAANDFEVSWPVSVLCGGLDRQIEHHLFPTLPPQRLREIAPEVRAVCEKYGVEYKTDTWGRTLKKALGYIGALAKRGRRARGRAVHGMIAGRDADDGPTTRSPPGTRSTSSPSAARVPSRTIRFYQSRGALMPPEIRGRVAYYGPAHVERLKLIAQLQDRGLRIDAIRDLLASIDRGELDLAEWLGVEQQVQAPWANDQPRTRDRGGALRARGHPPARAPRRPAAQARLVERHSDVYLVRSPALLAIAMKLEAAGIDLETAALRVEPRAKAPRPRCPRTSWSSSCKRAADGAIAPRDLGNVFESLRPLGTEAVRVIFGRAMERELRKLYESGRMAKLPAKVRRSKKR